MRIIDCGLVEYQEAFALQEQLAADIRAEKEEETLLLLEHPSTYTIGRGGDPANILDPTIRVERINRGGDVTWHGPGQIVGYPLFNLGRRGCDLHCWLRFLEELLMFTLASFGIMGRCRYGTSGVWTEGGKIAFIGIGVRRWITMHGFSLNVDPDLRAFHCIIPCGLHDCPVTSMAREREQPLSEAAVKSQLKTDFERLLHERLPLS